MKRILTACATLLLSVALRASPATEREAVAAVLILEAGGTGEQGMQAVCHVVFNRAAAGHKTPLAIVTAKSQFTVMRLGAYYAIAKARKHPEWRTALSIYDKFRTNRPYDFTMRSTHFESFKGKTPWWAKRMTATVNIGGNQFYRPKAYAR